MSGTADERFFCLRFNGRLPDRGLVVEPDLPVFLAFAFRLAAWLFLLAEIFFFNLRRAWKEPAFFLPVVLFLVCFLAFKPYTSWMAARSYD
ncbi:hypothetical protein [Paenibacillus tarimensis]|uniref:hypothetical protein n=1 Tax=Paenibacillus tarimensis TaxID=416012 RepID=UPI001F4790EB|nr:hypothetical protein [Paenibacillus tarimensis]MCF2945549.1 hypothetical protein [Paenibacillus tarimensis]